MRPERLELEGFTAFRQPTVVDFTDANLFALAGPTGAGKSSIVDGICFALYGSIPRYDDKRLVAPLISVGRAEAKVRLDFTVGRERYTAVRVGRRTPKGGATTKEARLERGGDLLAEDAASLTAAVKDLLGLGFEEFCRCVVLPQGAFARFLHDKASDRQDLLVGLLDLGLYGRVRDRTVERQRAAEGRVHLIQGQLQGDLALATAEAVGAARAKVGDIGDLVAAVRQSEQGIAAAAKRSEEAQTEVGSAKEQIERLARIMVPPAVPSLAQRVTDARAAALAALQAEQVSAAAVEAAEAAREAFGDAGPVERAISDHSDLDRLLAQRPPLVVAAEQVAGDAGRARLQATEALSRRRATEEHWEAVRQANRAAALHGELRTGLPCPVCQQMVTQVPELAVPEVLDAAQAAHKAAAEASVLADRSADTAGKRSHGAAVALEDHDRRIQERTFALDGALPKDRLAEVLAAIRQAEAELHLCRGVDKQARADRKRTAAELESANGDEGEGRRFLDAAVQALAGLEPPTPGRVDLMADWNLLVAWANSRVPAVRARATAAQGRCDQANRDVDASRSALVAILARAGVVARPGDTAGEAIAAALRSAEDAAYRLAENLERAGVLRAELANTETSALLAKELARHLNANHFEKWLLDEIIEELVAGATGTLRQLSNGAFSLVVDDRREFTIVDHRNANEQRPVRTLSGGETFLASLALALSLADRVAAFAAGGEARLESLFLDEGFGTLDPDALDTVAGAIEQLQAGGRMVGIVTHVQELAERVPVRFEVRPGPGGSTVERVAG